MFVGCDVYLQAEGKHFQHLLSIGQVKTQHLEQYVDLKRVDPHSRQTGRAASAALSACLPTNMGNVLSEE
jgi:hypothetical protein